MFSIQCGEFFESCRDGIFLRENLMKFLFLLLLVFPLAAQDPVTKGGVAEGKTEIPVKESDEVIMARLREVFEVIEDLSRVTVVSQHGVVTLGGELPSSRAREEVIELTSGTEGVIYVQDRTLDEV